MDHHVNKMSSYRRHARSQLRACDWSLCSTSKPTQRRGGQWCFQKWPIKAENFKIKENGPLGVPWWPSEDPAWSLPGLGSVPGPGMSTCHGSTTRPIQWHQLCQHSLSHLPIAPWVSCYCFSLLLLTHSRPSLFSFSGFSHPAPKWNVSAPGMWSLPSSLPVLHTLLSRLAGCHGSPPPRSHSWPFQMNDLRRTGPVSEWRVCLFLSSLAASLLLELFFQNTHLCLKFFNGSQPSRTGFWMEYSIEVLQVTSVPHCPILSPTARQSMCTLPFQKMTPTCMCNWVTKQYSRKKIVLGK